MKLTGPIQHFSADELYLIGSRVKAISPAAGAKQHTTSAAPKAKRQAMNQSPGLK